MSRASFSRDLPLYIAVVSFCIDSVTNFYIKVPVFVVSIPILIIFQILSLPFDVPRLRVIGASALVILSLLFSVVTYGPAQDNFSDALYIVFFVSSFYYAKYVPVSYGCLYACTFAMLALFVPTFFGFNNYMNIDDVFSSGSVDLEFYRVYNQGFFRLPHLAAYLLTYAGLWWLYCGIERRRIIYVAVSGLFMGAMIYAGSRTPIVVLVAAFILSRVRFRVASTIVAVTCVLIVAMLFLNIDDVLYYTYGTIFYQYATFIKTFSTDFDRLSRVIIWSNWITAMSEANFGEWLFGHGIAASFDYNLATIGASIWFHNDFLSILYSYGVPVFLLVSYLYLVLIRDSYRSSSRTAVVIGYFISLAAVVNGLYKYFPLFLMVIMYTIIRASSRHRHPRKALQTYLGASPIRPRGNGRS